MVGNATKIDLVHDPVHYIKAFETEDTIYCCHDNYAIEDIAKFLKCDMGDLKVISNYKLVRLTKESLLYLEYMEGKHTIPLINDENLNKLVDGKNERITMDELDSIIELIKTRDSDNIALAAKIFTQFNASATPCLTKTFLMFYHETISRLSTAGTSVVYKNLITQFVPVYKNMYNIESLLKNIPPVDKDELEMVRKIILPYITADIDSKVEDRKGVFEGLGLKIRIEIDEA